MCPITNSLSAHSVPRSLCSSIEKAHRKDLEASTGSLCLCKFYFTMRATARENPLFPHALFNVYVQWGNIFCIKIYIVKLLIGFQEIVSKPSILNRYKKMKNSDAMRVQVLTLFCCAPAHYFRGRSKI